MDAFNALSLADRLRPLDASDLCSLAWSAFSVGRDDDFVGAMGRAHRSYVYANESWSAARCAFWLGFVLGRRGDIGPASGWLERARRLLDRDEQDCVERGYLLLTEVMVEATAGSWDAVHALSIDAAGLGERFGEADLTAFARHWQGRALVRMGRSTEGFALLEESMVSVTADALSPLITGVIYCSMIEACQEVCDVGRSQQWTRALSAWCDGQPDLVPFSAQCLVHRAELMALHGAWQDAVNEAARAAALAAHGGDQPAAAAAVYLQGEIHRLRGEFVAAVEDYEQASRFGRDPQPGLALVRLAEGDLAAATAAIRRACDEANEPLDRVRLLPALVDIVLAAGSRDEAGEACRELSEASDVFGTKVLGAIAASAGASAGLAAGDPRSSLRAVRRAATVWQELEAPYELTRARTMAGQACRALGDHDAAGLEFAAARETFARLGAAPDLSRIDALSVGIPSTVGLLSERELQVLRLVASGQTNKAIAAELFVSEKTIERHVSNILTKLGVRSRAAATAYAYEHGLL